MVDKLIGLEKVSGALLVALAVLVQPVNVLVCVYVLLFGPASLLALFPR